MLAVPVFPLGEVCSFVGGGTPSRKNPEYFDGSIPWATVKDFKGFRISDTEEHITESAIADSATNLVPTNTVLLVSRVGLGKVAIADCPLAINQDIKGITPRNDVMPEYLFWFLLWKAPEIERMGTGATVKGVTLNDIKSIQIPVPPLAEQRRIVDILSRAEGIVRLRREAQKKAAEIIPALFLDMFGDPATNPKGWREVSLGSVMDEFRYGTSQKSGQTGYPTLRIPNVIGDSLDTSEIKFVAAHDAEVERLRLQDGDLLFVRTNGNQSYVGRSAVFNADTMKIAGFDHKNCLYASYLIRGRIIRDVISPYYLQAFLSSAEGRRKLKERCRTSAGQYNINIEGLSSVKLPLPSLDRQLEFVSLCPDIFSIQSQQTMATEKAEATFAALLGRAFQGEL